jgi:hypothetical protein
MMALQTKLFRYVIRVPKEHSAFTYFQLEAHDGMAFYSTLDESLGQAYRDIEVMGTVDYQKPLLHLFEELKKQFTIYVLVEEILSES